jgi:hypothetical protein
MNRWRGINHFIFSGIFCALSIAVFATPIISVGSGGDVNWTGAGSQIQSIPPADGFTSPELIFYTNFVVSNNLNGLERRQSSLTRDFPQPPGGPNGNENLVNSWTHPDDPNVLGVVSWEYRYNDDPDLTGTRVLFPAYMPAGIQDVSVILIDEDGRARGWFSDSPAPGGWINYEVNPLLGAQGSFNFFFSQPGFDLTRVFNIRLNASAYANAPILEPDPTTGEFNPWGGWNSLYVVVPEPGTLIILASGLLGLGARRRRSRK